MPKQIIELDNPIQKPTEGSGVANTFVSAQEYSDMVKSSSEAEKKAFYGNSPKVCIAGSRDFDNYNHLKSVCDELFSEATGVKVISGKAKGADSLGEKWAEEKGFEIIERPAPWDDIEGKPDYEIGVNKFGKKYWKLAGFARNKIMVDEADIVVVFWDGKSSGTKDTIEYAMNEGKEIVIEVF